MRYLALLLFVMIMNHSGRAQIEKIYESDPIFNAPESIAFDSLDKVLYVSNFHGVPKEGEPRNADVISKVSLTGEMLEKDFIEGLTAPTGICVNNRKLYIVERDGVVVYNLDKGEKICKYDIDTDNFLNDITLDAEGNIYVTVSGTSTILRISKGKVETWLDSKDIDNPNGILYTRGLLLVGTTSDGCIKKVNLQTREVSLFAHLGETIVDGLRPCGSGYLTSLFEGNLLWVSKNGEVRELLNTRDQGTFLADFEYIEPEGLVVIPTLWNNKILIYKYEPPG